MHNKNTNPLPYYKVNTCLSVGAMDFLSETSNGTSHFAILSQLIKNTCTQASATSKRGNTINLCIGQVECSVHSYCEQFGIKRKKFESIMRQLEQLGVIRMHRSRLATVADMLCIDSWQMNDDTVLYNDIRFTPALPHSDEKPKQESASDGIIPNVASVPESDASASCDCFAQSPADTEQSCPQEPTAAPVVEQSPSGSSANSGIAVQTSQGKPQEPTLDLFANSGSLDCPDNAPDGRV
jgi:glutaminase